MRETRSQPVAGDGGPLDQIAPPHQVPPRGGIPVRAWQVPLHRVGEAVVDVEQDAGVDRVLYPIIAEAGGAERGEDGGAPGGGGGGAPAKGGGAGVWGRRGQEMGSPAGGGALPRPSCLPPPGEGGGGGGGGPDVERRPGGEDQAERGSGGEDSPRSAASPRSSRPKAAPSAADTVTSKRTSSEVPARCSAPRSSSVTW